MRRHLQKGAARLAAMIAHSTGISTKAEVEWKGEACVLAFKTQGNGWPVLLEVREDMSFVVLDLCNERVAGRAPPTTCGTFSAREAFRRLVPVLESFSLVPKGGPSFEGGPRAAEGGPRPTEAGPRPSKET